MILLKTTKSSANLWCKTTNKRGGVGASARVADQPAGHEKSAHASIMYAFEQSIRNLRRSTSCRRVRVNDASSRALASRAAKSLRRPRRVFQAFYLLDRPRQHRHRNHLRDLLAGH